MLVSDIKISELKPYAKNARKHPQKQVDLLAKNIEKFGFTTPVLVDEHNNVIAGHGRLLAIKQLGWDSVPCVKIEGLTPEEVKALRLADNKIAGMGEDDMQLVIEELKELSVPMLDLTVFDKDLVLEPDEKDDVIPENVPPVAELGDIWQLGSHRVMCGDSTKLEDVEKLMDGVKADITFHSPPYNVGETPNGNKQKYLNDSDNKSDGDYISLLQNTTNNGLLNSEYVFVNLQSVASNKLSLIEFLASMKEKFADYIIWDKMRAEPAMAFNVLNSRFEFVYVFSSRATRAIGTTQFRGNLDNIVTINSRKDKEFSFVHKATFPVELATHFVSNFAEHSVLDLFLGTGSTLIAAEKTGRICYGMELDPKYVDVIIKRWEDYTGEKAKKL